MKYILSIFLMISVQSAWSQKPTDICFNLYTDSLKKGVHNYINVDGKLKNGSYLPLMVDEITLTSTEGKWEGNSLIISRDTKMDSVIITAVLKSDTTLQKRVTIYIKKVETEPELKTEKELLEEWQKKRRRKN